MSLRPLEYKTILTIEFLLVFVITAAVLFFTDYYWGIKPLSFFTQFNKTSIYGSIISASLGLVGFLISAIAFLLALVQKQLWASSEMKLIFSKIFELWYSFIQELILLSCLSFAALFIDTTELASIYAITIRFFILALFIVSVLRLRRSAIILKSITDICMATS